MGAVSTESEIDGWKSGAGSGDSSAMFELGMHSKAEGNPAEAKTWFEKAAQAGHVRAMLYLGRFEEDRDNLVEAERWFRRAADSGDIDAVYNLAYFLKDSDPIESEALCREGVSKPRSTELRPVTPPAEV
jgi:TPR repeat protein